MPAAAALVTDGKDSLEAKLLLSYNAQVAVLQNLWLAARLKGPHHILDLHHSCLKLVVAHHRRDLSLSMAWHVLSVRCSV